MQIKDAQVGMLVGVLSTYGAITLTRIQKITPSGQIVVKQTDIDGKPLRFYPPFYDDLLTLEDAQDRMYCKIVEDIRYKINRALYNRCEQVQKASQYNRIRSADALRIDMQLKNIILAATKPNS